MMNFINGTLFNFSKDDKNLVAFVSINKKGELCSNALVLIPGMTDGFLSMAYTSSLSNALQKIDYSVVLIQISSSFLQFGFGSIQNDCKEITTLISFLKKEMKFRKIVLLGHSTGAQDTLYFLSHGHTKELVDAVVLQGAVSDRDYILSEPSLLKMLEQAHKYKAEGSVDSFLEDYLFCAPITARRFLSVAERLSDEDMFSADLTEEELRSILEPIRIPILLCFSSKDEFVPDHSAYKDTTERMVKILKSGLSSHVECRYFDGDHGLTTEEMYRPFIDSVETFLKKSV